MRFECKPFCWERGGWALAQVKSFFGRLKLLAGAFCSENENRGWDIHICSFLNQLILYLCTFLSVEVGTEGNLYD